MRLERLTHVHNGESGAVGQLIAEMRGVLRFNSEGSGLLEIERLPPNSLPPASSQPPAPGEVSVRIMQVPFSALPFDVQKELGDDQVPCILGHSGVDTVVLVAPRSLARATGGASDLRGKIRYGLARVGWSL